VAFDVILSMFPNDLTLVHTEYTEYMSISERLVCISGTSMSIPERSPSMSALSIEFERLMFVVKTVQTTKFQPLDNDRQKSVTPITYFSSTSKCILKVPFRTQRKVSLRDFFASHTPTCFNMFS